MNIINRDVTEYIEKYYSPLSQELGKIRAYAEERLIPIILKDTEMMLLSLLDMQKPERILEVGTAIGYSSLVMATHLPGCKIVTIDNDIRGVKRTKETAKTMNLDDRVKVIYGDAREVLTLPHQDVILPEGKFYDFVFIDGGKSHYRKFWDGIMPMLCSGSIVVCDNVLMRAKVVADAYDTQGDFRTSVRKMRAFIDYLMDMDIKKVQTSLLPVGDGVTISYIR